MSETPLASDLTGATLLSDSELVLRARQGDRRSFGTLYLRHHDAAWRVACAAAGSATDAEDAVAEGFAKVFAALPRMVDRELAFRPYLLACVRNAAVDRHRRTRKLDLRDEVPERAVAASEPDEIVLADLERNLVGEALRSLPERWRTVLWLTEVEGMTPTEVSAVIGIKPNAVAALSYRAREGLREAYLQAHVRAEAKADCRYTVDRLSPYVRNELSDRERDKVQTHLDGCAGCRQRRDELADVNASLLGALVPVPLLLGSRTQQEWLSVAHLGKGTRRAKAPAKAAKTAQLGTSAAVQRTMAVVVALLLFISGGVAIERFGPGGRVGKTFDPVALPKHPTPPTPPAVEAAPTETALPAPVTAPTPKLKPRKAAEAPVELAAPVLAPEPTQAASPAPEPAPAPAPAPEPAPEPPAPTPPPQEPPAPPPAPEPPPAAAAKASLGEGDTGAVFAMSVPNDPQENPQPDVDVTVGSTPLVGDAPPSDGTDVDVAVSPETALRDLPHFHTAAARAAAFPGLQPEIESFASSEFWAQPTGGSLESRPEVETLSGAPATAADQTGHHQAGGGQGRPAGGGDRRLPCRGRFPAAEAGEHRFLIRMSRVPAFGPEAVDGHHPGVHEVGHLTRRQVDQPGTEQAPQCPLHELRPDRRLHLAADEGAELVARQPALGSDVVDAGQVPFDGEGDRLGGVVLVDELHRRHRPADRQRDPGPDEAGDGVVGPGAEDERRAQHGRGDGRAGQRPLGQQPLQFRLVDTEREPGIRAERRVLGEGDRVVRPRAVDRGAGHQDDLGKAGGGGRLEDPPGAADVDAGHEVLVGDGVVYTGQVDEDVDPLEQRPQVGPGHVDEVELQPAGTETRFPHVETHQLPDGRRAGQSPEHGLAEKPGHTGDGHGGRGRCRGGVFGSQGGVSRSLHPHRLAA